MKTHLVCYADQRFQPAQVRLVASARRHGVDVVHAFSPADLRSTAFYAAHREILDQPRGGGYCLWKPFYIDQVLRQATPGDVVLYVDSGAEFVASPKPLVRHAQEVGGLALFRNFGRPNRCWTKRDCFVRLDCDTPEAYDADQITAAFGIFVVGSEEAESFVGEWLKHCTDAQLLTDAPNACGRPELPDFITHLYDQSIASLLAYKRGLTLYRDPSQYGNHRKPESLRVAGEYLDLPYTRESCDKSDYPTIFNHHRQGAAPPSLPHRASAWVKRQIRKVVPKRWPNHYFTAADLSVSMERNRRTLAGVERWFDEEADATSQFSYGVPAHLRVDLDRPVGDQPTVPDLIGNLSAALGERLNYLEIGVSVGKNFWQQIRSGKLRTLTGFDIEEIHPNLRSRLTEGERIEWAPAADSLKRGVNSLTKFADHVQGNRIRYLAGDVFDESCWRHLEDKPYNFIYSDALHRPEGLMWEWRMIQRHGLLDLDEFVMVWDDLGGYMTTAFEQISRQVQQLAGPCRQLRFRMRGWMGVNEYPHEIGVLAKLSDPPDWLAKVQSDSAKEGTTQPAAVRQ